MIRDTNRAAANVVAKLSTEIGREVTAEDLWQLVRAIDTAKVLVTERHEALALRTALIARARQLVGGHVPHPPAARRRAPQADPPWWLGTRSITRKLVDEPPKPSRFARLVKQRARQMRAQAKKTSEWHDEGEGEDHEEADR